jgi:AcrR family transcriptional regulator
VARRSEDTKSQFLAEGKAMLFERGVPVALGNISLVEVAERLERTTGAAYNIWPSQTDFHRDLAIRVAKESAEHDGIDLVQPVIHQCLAEAVVWREATRRIFNAYLEIVLRRRGFFIGVHYVAVALDEPAVAQALKNSYDELHSATKDSVQAFAEIYDLQLHSSYTYDQLVMSINALTEGYLMRACIDPESARSDIARTDLLESPVGWSAYSIAVERLITSMLANQNR